MPENEGPVREVYAIPDDDIDVRLIQRQIANAIAASKGKKASTDSIKKPLDPIIDKSGAKAEASSEPAPDVAAETPSAEPPSAPVIKVTSGKNINSKEDSMDINELVNDTVADVSLDLLEQLTSKINSEMGVVPEPVEVEPEDTLEDNINSLEQQEEISAVAEINKDNEKTVVTEQICEYPIKQVDSEYIQSLDYLEGDKKYKKYVIYIDEINDEFINTLSVKERKDLINSILHEQDIIRIRRREAERMKHFCNKLLIAVFTVFVLIPILYGLVNFCAKSSIENMNQQRMNFQVLFR